MIDLMDKVTEKITPLSIQEDSKEIRKFALKTPLIRLHWLDIPNRRVWAKLECNQLTNSFKVRGAYNCIRKVDKEIPIITNSAGNHGLAVAYVLQQLHRKGKIFVPENASELKLRRLVNMGVEVLPIGKDLYTCGENAKKVAEEMKGFYISPFATPNVIIGQGSLAVEILEQKEHFDNVLIPLGGGGLLIGMATYFKYKDENCRIHAIHPKVFNRDFSKGYAQALSKPIYPTIADGLAVQHSEQDNIAGLVEKLCQSVEQVSEEEIEIGIVSMLSNEGLLIEGASATGIAALLKDTKGEKYNGDVLVVISGGNISTSSIMHALATHTNNIQVGKLVGFNSTTLPQESVQYKRSYENRNCMQAEEISYKNCNDIWNHVLKNIKLRTQELQNQIKELYEYSKYEKLELNFDVIDCVSKDVENLKKVLKKISKERELNKKRESIRIVIQKYSYLRNSLAWCSASSAQSKRVMFFDPAENNDSACNYDRYGSLVLREKELAIQQSLGFDTEQTGLLVTSSGQAAYTVAESFLLRNIFSKEPTVVSCPYIYFENLEQIESLKNVNFIVSPSWKIEDIIKLVEENSAEALFIDPLANLGTLHTIDFREFAKQLEGHDWSQKWLLIDGTMVSGGIDVFKIFNKANHPHILYIESGSKYLQFGLDLQMMGIVVAEKAYLPILNTHRRNTGTVMYQAGVTKLPEYNREMFLSRMHVLTRNAEILCKMLKEINKKEKKINITFPYNWRELGWKHGGGIVAINFVEEGVNNKPCLDFLIDLIIDECEKEEIPITKGVSFGFSTIRISAAAAMAQNRPPFLRFSMGEESIEEMHKLCKMIRKCFEIFFEKYNI